MPLLPKIPALLTGKQWILINCHNPQQNDRAILLWEARFGSALKAFIFLHERRAQFRPCSIRGLLIFVRLLFACARRFCRAKGELTYDNQRGLLLGFRACLCCLCFQENVPVGFVRPGRGNSVTSDLDSSVQTLIDRMETGLEVSNSTVLLMNSF